MELHLYPSHVFRARRGKILHFSFTKNNIFLLLYRACCFDLLLLSKVIVEWGGVGLTPKYAYIQSVCIYKLTDTLEYQNSKSPSIKILRIHAIVSLLQLPASDLQSAISRVSLHDEAYTTHALMTSYYWI